MAKTSAKLSAKMSVKILSKNRAITNFVTGLPRSVNNAHKQHFRWPFALSRVKIAKKITKTCFISTGQLLVGPDSEYYSKMKLKQLFGNIPTHMDYEGQKFAERLFHIIILSFGVVGFLWGYYIQQFGATVIILAAGFIVSSLVVLPPWPIYRRNPLDWQKPRPEKPDVKREGGKKKQKAN